LKWLAKTATRLDRIQKIQSGLNSHRKAELLRRPFVRYALGRNEPSGTTFSAVQRVLHNVAPDVAQANFAGAAHSKKDHN